MNSRLELDLEIGTEDDGKPHIVKSLRGGACSSLRPTVQQARAAAAAMRTATAVAPHNLSSRTRHSDSQIEVSGRRVAQAASPGYLHDLPR